MSCRLDNYFCIHSRRKKDTSTPGIIDNMTNAGAIWLSEPVLTDGQFVSSRRPPDLPEYLPELIKVLEKISSLEFRRDVKN